MTQFVNTTIAPIAVLDLIHISLQSIPDNNPAVQAHSGGIL